jgi:hypothetical protein
VAEIKRFLQQRPALSVLFGLTKVDLAKAFVKKAGSRRAAWPDQGFLGRPLLQKMGREVAPDGEVLRRTINSVK